MDQAEANVSPQNIPPFQTSSQPESEVSATPISDLIAQPDFPECTRGKFVNIGGSQGTVVDIVGNSLKVRSSEGTTMSFNCHVLKRIHGPREEQKPISRPADTETQRSSRYEKVKESAPEEAEVEAPKRNIIMEPNFDVPVKPISDFTGRADFPQCTFGEYIDVGGYKGVVIEIVKGSLKVRSPEEVIRSYNSQVLRKLYPAGK